MKKLFAAVFCYSYVLSAIAQPQQISMEIAKKSGFFLITMGFLLLLLVLLKKRYPGRESNIKLGETIQLNHKEKIFVIEYQRKKYLLMIAGDSLLKIDEFNLDG